MAAAKGAKYGFGWLTDLTRAEPVAVAKHAQVCLRSIAGKQREKIG